MTQNQDDKAKAWSFKHKEHIKQMLDSDLSGYGACEPSKEDAGSPELWKPIHWRWFFIHA